MNLNSEIEDIEKSMKTRWSDEALAGRGHQEYPRPQMVRDEWVNLNGKWDYAISGISEETMPEAQGKILVPYPVQSMLSGVQKQVKVDQALWYRRTFEVAEHEGRTLLHFGAVDWHSVVEVNGMVVGEHKGGYDPFRFDVSEALREGENELIVKVIDPTDQADQPHGKQVMKPGGIWYTAVTGIWQTVWMERVPQTSISEVYCETTIDGGVTVNVGTSGDVSGALLRAEVLLNGTRVGLETVGVGSELRVVVPDPQLWEPESPTLYDLEVSLIGEDGGVLDRVDSYFGIREIGMRRDGDGQVVTLNGEDVFMYGPLDQGWWPDGLYTPPTDDALRFDLEYTKRAGFNTVRKHVKVEGARFYRHCDELGLLVWQDMPHSLSYQPGWDRNWRKENPKADSADRPEASRKQFLLEWERIMTACRAFPSVVMWVPFNESWGQHDTVKVTEFTKRFDPTRLVNSASGGNFVNTGDILDIHVYPGPASPDPLPGRAIVLGEFGGLGLPVAGHTWQDEDNWGYRSFETSAQLMDRYERLIDSLLLVKKTGLSGAIYTQTTDVEIEVNGLLTYDRAISKMPIDWLARVNRKVYGPAVELQDVLATADVEGSLWMYVLSDPGRRWEMAGFDDSGWEEGMSGFGTAETPGSTVRTVWDGSVIWLRKEFELKEVDDEMYLKIHHDEDAKVYLNGRLIFEAEGYTSQYEFHKIDREIFKVGKNVLAVSCRQTRGGQYIDVGFSRRMGL